MNGVEEFESEASGGRSQLEYFTSSSYRPASPRQNMDDSTPPSSVEETFLVGFVIVNIVGLRYYQGRISGREIVGLVREELNPYDENAIKVINTRSIQVGHIERSAAALLSPMIDSGWITIEGIVPKPLGKGMVHKLLCQVHIFAKLEDFESVKSVIEMQGLHLISQRNASFTLSEAVAVKEKKAATIEKSVDEIFKFLELKISKESALKALDPPKDIIKAELFMHQKEGLGWLVSRENSGELPPFWEERDGAYVNELTNYQSDIIPEPLLGGIYADDMGMGKTLTLLSLIAFDKSAQGLHSFSVKDVEDDGEGSEAESTSVSGSTAKRKRASRTANSSRKGKKVANANSKKLSKKAALDKLSSAEPRATLIVCPPTVLSAWVTQIEEHTIKGSLKVYMYYGDRTEDAKELQKHDIVLTTYNTLANEISRGKSVIGKMEWRRVILDEAHLIKNPKSQQTSAVINLNAKRRWAVTGTPVQNNSFDLFSLVAFLKFEPLSMKSLWITLIHRPLAQGDGKGISRLQILMDAISLRRTKDKVLDWLPRKSIVTVFVNLREEERRVYDQLEEEAGKIVKGYISNETTIMKNYSTILGILVRLRQICDDLTLCPADIRSQLPQSQIEDLKNNPALLEKLLSILQDGEDFDCPICISPPTDIIITCCAHIFCESCIRRTIKQTKPCCPMCRQPLSESDLFRAPPESNQATTSVSSSSSISSKVAALLTLLTASRETSPSSKSVIFSQFQKMLLLLEHPLQEAGFKVIRLDGSMSTKRRAQAIKDFSTLAPHGPTIMLASLKASGVGINLTAASRVYLMEPWWNPAVEEQALDRVHRIGQKEDVEIVRLIARHTVEERVLQLQEKKRMLARNAFGGKSKKDVREMNRDDLATLMNL